MTNKDAGYKKDLNDLKEQILKDGNTLVSKRDLLERFCGMDEAYNGCPWNLLQTLANIDVLTGEESCEDAEDVVERKKIDNAILAMEREQNSKFWNSSFRNGIGYALELLKKNLDIEESKSKGCRDCHYNDGEVHAECVLCDKAGSKEQG